MATLRTSGELLFKNFLAASMLVLSVSIPVNSHAQTVRGRLVHAETGTGIGGAMITLVDRHGGTADRTLTANTGLFQLSAPSGRYRLRADRIGYASTHSEYFDLQAREVVHLDIFASTEAITLVGIDVTGGPRCRIRPAEGLAVAQVWEEARKALAAAAWTQERGCGPYPTSEAPCGSIPQLRG